jgi:nucleotide-binding universal stress UspA family protein
VIPNPSTIIVATDGREQSDGAIRAATLFAELGDAWRIVSVVPPFPVVSAELDLHISAEVLDASRDERRRVVHEQVRRVLGQSVKVGVDVRNGDPAAVVSRTAAEAGVKLIITGLGRHRLVDRLLADETTLHIIRSAPTPVLAVPPEFSRAPQTAIVGVDFSETSLRAARLALHMVRGAATVYLANVAPREDAFSLATGGRAAYVEQATTKLHQLADELKPPELVHLQPVVRHGDPGTALLSYAADTRSELIAIGTRGLGLVSRLLLGSVATKVIRGSTIPVLTVPA